MKSMSRLAALLALVLVALFPATAVAVHGQAAPCNGLADADCDLLQGAIGAEGMAKLTSFTADFSLAGSIAGTDTDDGDVNLTGTGSFSIAPEVIAALKPASDNSKPVDLLPLIKAKNAVMFDTTLKAGGSLAGSTGGTFELRAVDDSLYFKGDPVTQGKWNVIDLPASIDYAQSYIADAILNALQSIFQSNDTPPNLFEDPKVQADFAALMKVPGVFKYAAGDGPTVDSQATRKITASLDVATVVNAPELKTLITDLIVASGQPIDPAEVVNTMDAPVLVQMLKNSSLQQNWLVGTTDKLLHGYELALVVKIDPTYIATVTNNPDAKEFDGIFDLNIQLSKIGQPVKVDPVPDAQRPSILSFFAGAQPAPTAAP